MYPQDLRGCTSNSAVGTPAPDSATPEVHRILDNIRVSLEGLTWTREAIASAANRIEATPQSKSPVPCQDKYQTPTTVVQKLNEILEIVQREGSHLTETLHQFNALV
jgi:hypothetical protein